MTDRISMKKNKKTKIDDVATNGVKTVTRKIDGMRSAVEDYETRLSDIGRPLSCVISVRNAIPHGEFSLLDVTEDKNTVGYEKDGAWWYEPSTHVLAHDTEKYFLSCANNGTAKLFSFDDDVSNPIGKVSVCEGIFDPMLAFSSHGKVYVIFNVPTKETVDAGANARKPISSSDDAIVVSSGYPMMACFDTRKRNAELMSKASNPMTRYAIGLIDDPDGNIPAVLLANILSNKTSDADDDRPSFSILLSDEHKDKLDDSKRTFPMGVFATRIGEDEEFSQVPMSGSRGFGIEKISLSKNDDCNTNTIRIVASDITVPLDSVA